MPLKNAAPTVSKNDYGGHITHVLVMSISDPRERACNADRDSEVGNHTHNKDCVVVVLVVDEYERHAEYEPDEAGCCAS